MEEDHDDQILLSAGMGLGAQNVMLVASVAVAPVDMPLATTILTFTQTLASAVFLPLGQSVFQNELQGNLRGVLGAGEVKAMLQAGAVGFLGVVPESQMAGVLAAYNGAVVRAFYVAVAMAGVSAFGPVVMRCLPLTGKRKGDGKGEEKGPCEGREEGAGSLSVGEDEKGIDGGGHTGFIYPMADVYLRLE
ncbi:hypothetical protein BO82DRAFT_199306 [Aspergillus uvarum CBS 121591]|uniref:MFS general substrate transporter n=1 Tax=Aspergillus uvarum CBS 121591 TaxID=1448315 RepID=A0A319CIS7_9EURO|nr:hypothetical protein BO82DRAFT_199306 [Aspergillus uvarum CBS 121591]PYH85094.1 hypothetical protein BO82DRAFT_199306 [Aspergillus uvarum CBS 121591]